MPISKTQLNDFLVALSVDRGNLGLIVTAGDAGALIVDLPNGTFERTEIGKDADPEQTIASLLAVAKNKHWCRLDHKDGELSGRVYNQLRALGTSGHLQIVNPPGKEKNMIDMLWPAESKVLVVISRASLEKITVSTFLNLFGPILREE